MTTPCRTCPEAGSVAPSRARVSQRVPDAGASSLPVVPAIVHDVLRTSGRALDPPGRARMETRFGHDFSGVRVHADARAAASARALGARAYTIGQHVVFGADATITGALDERVLAHELVHTLQQRGGATAATTLGAPGDAAEREADALSARAMRGPAEAPLQVRTHTPGVLRRLPLPDAGTLPRSTTAPRPTAATLPPATPHAPPRGPNPADCLDPLCVAAGRRPVPASDAAAIRRVDAWEQGALACLQSGAAASNASHQAAIVANEQSEIRAAATDLRAALPALGRSPRRYLDFLDIVRETCSRKAQEVRVEFRYNVVFDNPPATSPAWGYGDADWPSVEGALSALPESATWANPQLITFARAGCHPQDLNAAGQCVGHGAAGGTGLVGGETDPGTGRITVYDAGVGAQPYSRSASLRLPATQQTLRHEVGHVIDAQIPRAERERFFRDILPWYDYPWAWISSPPGRPANWQAERDRLRGALGLDEAGLDRWLAALRPSAPVVARGITYTRDAAGGGGATLFLTAVDASRLPAGREFEYARSSRGEYIAELYALAVSRPDFLYGAIPQAQSEWLKRVVFRTPATADAWARELAVVDAIPPDLMVRLLRTYTWEQARPIIDEILRRQPLPGGARRV